MREKLVNAGRWMLRRPAHWLALIVGALLLTNWILAEVGRGPFPDILLFMIPVAVMVGLAPWIPFASLAIMVLLPLAQIGGLVIGPSSITWPVWLAGVLVALILGAIAEGRVRRFTLLAGFVAAALIAYLMAAPGPQGSWAQWIGNYALGERVHPHREDFVMIFLVGFALYLLAWLIGVAYRMALQGKFSRIAALLAENPDGRVARPVHTTLSGLSPRELEIYALVARGLSNAEIASREHISETTVKTHVSSILRKLELRSRTQLAAHAVDKGLVAT